MNTRTTLAISILAIVTSAARAGDCGPLGGSALRFAGAADAVEVPHADTLEFVAGDAITIEAWVRLDDIEGYATIIGKNPLEQSNYALRLHGGKIVFSYRDDADTMNVSYWSQPVVGAGTGWRHVAVTHVFASEALTMYLDGKAIDGAWYSDPGPAPLLAPGALRIGVAHENGQNVWPLEGTIDDVRIWRLVRSEEEIRATMSAELTGNEPGLLAWWSLDDGAGSAVLDRAGGHDGTRVGASWIETITCDCDDNGSPDAYDIAVGAASDCDRNGIPDACDLTSNADDCDRSEVPDRCELSPFPSALAENTTGFADEAFVGPPDGGYIGIGGQIVTYDFDDNPVVDGAGADITVYEVDWGTRESSLIDVFVSWNGVDYYEITSTRSSGRGIPGDEMHDSSGFRASYDIAPSGLAKARYVRLDGTGGDPSGYWVGFDLDAIGAVHTLRDHRCAPGDVNRDAAVDMDDVLRVLRAWGPCAACPEDIDGNGIVESEDVLVVLANWT